MSQIPAIKLGEEMPIFCRRCGAVLHGMEVVACEKCALPHFHCPQCGNDELVHTLRPAVAPVANRAALAGLTLWVGCKILFFLWFFFVCWALSLKLSYRLVRTASFSTHLHWQDMYHYQPLEINLGVMLACGICGFLFGGVGRLLLLGWRKGIYVGLTLALLLDGVLIWGAMTRLMMLVHREHPDLQHAADTVALTARWSNGMLVTLLWTSAMVILAASIARPVALGMVRLMTPRRWSQAILRWESAWAQPSCRVRTADHLDSVRGADPTRIQTPKGTVIA